MDDSEVGTVGGMGRGGISKEVIRNLGFNQLLHRGGISGVIRHLLRQSLLLGLGKKTHSSTGGSQNFSGQEQAGKIEEKSWVP